LQALHIDALITES